MALQSSPPDQKVRLPPRGDTHGRACETLGKSQGNRSPREMETSAVSEVRGKSQSTVWANNARRRPLSVRSPARFPCLQPNGHWRGQEGGKLKPKPNHSLS